MGSGQLFQVKDKISTSANIMRPIINIKSEAKSYIHIIIVLANLDSGLDDSSSDELFTLKESKPFFIGKNSKSYVYWISVTHWK